MNEEYARRMYLDKLKDTINSELQILFVKTGWVIFEISILTNIDHLRENRVIYSVSLSGYAKDELIADAGENHYESN